MLNNSDTRLVTSTEKFTEEIAQILSKLSQKEPYKTNPILFPSYLITLLTESSNAELVNLVNMNSEEKPLTAKSASHIRKAIAKFIATSELMSAVDVADLETLTPQQYVVHLLRYGANTLNLDMEQLDPSIFNLNGKYIYKLQAQQWRNLLTGIALLQIKILFLSGNFLGQTPEPEFQIFAKNLARTDVIELYLVANFLHQLSVNGWQALGEALNKSDITILTLNKNKLHDMEPAAWNAMCNAFASSKVKTLNLRENYFNKVPADYWQAFGQALGVSDITTLNLNKNKLHQFSFAAWQALCEAFAESNVVTLSLRENNLHELTAQYWQIFGSALTRSTIRELDLSENGLDDLSEAQWQDFCAAITNTPVVVVKISDLAPERQQQLDAVLQNNKNKPPLRAMNFVATLQAGDVNDFEQLLNQFAERLRGFSSDELIAFIPFLEQEGSPTAIFTAGLVLLYEGYTQNAPHKSDPNEKIAYRLKVIHDGITFLLQAGSAAAVDPSMKNHIDAVLWHLRNSDNESITKRLSACELEPPFNLDESFPNGKGRETAKVLSVDSELLAQRYGLFSHSNENNNNSKSHNKDEATAAVERKSPSPN